MTTPFEGAGFSPDDRKRLPEPGDTVTVRRTSGDIEDDWVLQGYNTQNGNAMVSKMTEDGREMTKEVNYEDFVALNEQESEMEGVSDVQDNALESSESAIEAEQSRVERNFDNLEKDSEDLDSALAEAEQAGVDKGLIEAWVNKRMEGWEEAMNRISVGAGLGYSVGSFGMMALMALSEKYPQLQGVHDRILDFGMHVNQSLGYASRPEEVAMVAAGLLGATAGHKVFKMIEHSNLYQEGARRLQRERAEGIA